MKPKRLNPIQVAASAAGAVLAAVIASFFGVEGTIIGTAVGSIVATTVSAIVWESIERGHDAVRQVVVRDGSPLLHRGSTESAGEVTRADAQASAVEAQVDAGLDAQVSAGRPAPGLDAAPDQHRPEEAPADTAVAGQAEVVQQSPLDPTLEGRVGTAAGGGATVAAGADVTGPRRLLASSRGGHPAPVRRTSASPGPARRVGPFRRPWVVVASVVVVFVVALGVITVVEVIVGRPISSMTTGSKTNGTTVFGGSPTTTTSTTSPPTSSTTTSPSSTTTTSSSTTTTTTTTTPSSTTTTTTSTTTPSAGAGTSGAGSAGAASAGAAASGAGGGASGG